MVVPMEASGRYVTWHISTVILEDVAIVNFDVVCIVLESASTPITNQHSSLKGWANLSGEKLLINYLVEKTVDFIWQKYVISYPWAVVDWVMTTHRSLTLVGPPALL